MKMNIYIYIYIYIYIFIYNIMIINMLTYCNAHSLHMLLYDQM